MNCCAGSNNRRRRLNTRDIEKMLRNRGFAKRVESVLKAASEVEATRNQLEPIVDLDSANIVEPPYSEFQKLMNDRYESAARAVCTLIGEQADRPVIEDHPTIAGQKVKAPFWHTYVQPVMNHDIFLMALVRTRADREIGADGRKADDPDNQTPTDRFNGGEGPDEGSDFH